MNVMIIEIVGTPSPKTLLLEKTVEKALKKLKLECRIIKVNDAKIIKEYGIITLPALVIDDHIIFTGRIPMQKELLDILSGRKTAVHG
ncbi:TPA: thioredoxin family protein [Patescibacteria group bacterium]|nr:thioredoxin family protein [Candidatus Gracilibacteria bacterium]